MSRESRTFEARRRKLLVTMSERCSAEPVRVTIPFADNDIPDFLDKLDKWEAASRKSRVKVP